MSTLRQLSSRHIAPPGVYPAPLLVLIFAACGTDPILERAQQDPATKPAATNPSSGSAAAPVPGVPAEPQPGIPAEPSPVSPGAAGDPAPGIPTEPSPGSPGGGPQILLSGRVVLSSGAAAPIRVDVFDGDQQDLSGPRPKVVGMAQLDQPGPFTVSVPADTARLWIGAYADMDQNGRPDPQDPAGWFAGNPVDLSAPLPEITLTLAPVAAPPPPP